MAKVTFHAEIYRNGDGFLNLTDWEIPKDLFPELKADDKPIPVRLSLEIGTDTDTDTKLDELTAMVRDIHKCVVPRPDMCYNPDRDESEECENEDGDD